MQIQGVINKALDRGFTVVKKSSIQGKGLFAKKIIPSGTRIIEYKGERILKVNISGDMEKGLTTSIYMMSLNEATVIDGERNGNNARFINHNCDPNCTVYFFNEIPYIYAIREITIGEELSFDYKLHVFNKAKKLTKKEQRQSTACFCKATNCRGTMLAKKFF
jgi:uncharacterized protein